MSVFRPVRVELELTEACNLACRFCYNSQNPVYCQEPETILDSLADAGVMELVLTGGEPALHPRFAQILEYATSRFPRVMVQSNGVLFADAKMLSLLAESNLFCVNFSLHGPAAVHDGLTGMEGSFDKTVTALRNVVDAGIRTASNMVLTSFNHQPESLDALVGILRDCGVREMTITRFIPCGVGTANAEFSVGRDEFAAAVEHLTRAGDANGLSVLLANATPVCGVPDSLRDHCNRCWYGHDRFYVDVVGQLLTCGMARLPLGSILERSVVEILAESEVYRAFRTDRHVPEACRECDDYQLCGGGCRAAALVGGHGLDSDDPLCFVPTGGAHGRE